jgi:hypothetical protein
VDVSMISARVDGNVKRWIVFAGAHRAPAEVAIGARIRGEEVGGCV